MGAGCDDAPEVAHLAAAAEVSGGEIEEPGLTVGTANDAEQHLDQRGLAGAVRAEQAENLATRHFQRDAAQA